MQIKCPISLGELVDKISILKVKKKFILDAGKLEHVDREDLFLTDSLIQLNLTGIEDYLKELIAINSKLWLIEDEIRKKERDKKFDEEFINLARSVYKVNDQRFFVKNKINEVYGSTLKEVKSYQDYNG